MKTVLAVLGAWGLLVPFASATTGVSAPTMSNLQSAFSGESNAHARYLAFAMKADREGYAGAASLFRAAARAEEIHANNHAAVIRKFGAEPEAKIANPVVNSTRENLQVALKGESYERDKMYPSFISQAKADGNTDAIRTFQFALAAEAEHAKLYAAALNDLESMKASRVFYVCPVCGFTAATLPPERCPTCATAKEHFEQVR